MFSNRTFGVEIEFIGSRSVVTNALIEAGLNASEERYNHSTRPYWKVTTDASIGYDNGELVSPILRGEEGLAALQKACRAMVAAGIRVNRTCGIHVHVGAADLNSKEVAAVCKRYAVQEDTFDSIMPASRRHNNSRWCASMKNFTIRMENATSMSSVSRMFHDNRYCKVNVQSYMRQSTIEFRQHSGSLNATKISNWVKLVTKFVDTTVDACRSLVAATPAPARTPVSLGGFSNPYRNGSKKHALYMLLESGTTVENAAARIGSTTSSVQTMISTIKRSSNTPSIRRRRDYFNCGGQYVYTFISGTHNQAAHFAAPASMTSVDYTGVFNLGAYHGMEDAVVGYYEERAMELAS